MTGEHLFRAAMAHAADLVSDLRHHRLAQRLYNTPLLLEPQFAQTMADFAGADIPVATPKQPGYVVAKGVAYLPIHGELVNRGSWLAAALGLTTYDGLQSALRQAADDPLVTRVLLDVDSPGGEAAGAMETAEEVRAVAATKPVVAFVNAMAASAAYAIASGASKVVVAPSATLGSIGVVFLHLDRSAAMTKIGIKPTLLHAGAYKIDGHTFAPLDPAARKRIQAQIGDVYGLLTDTIGKLRSQLGTSGARKTEAGLYIGRKAVDAGLADDVGSIDTALRFLSPQPTAKPNPLQELSRMSTFASSPAHASQDEVDRDWAETVGRISARSTPARAPVDQTTTGTSRHHQSQAEIDPTWAAIVAELNKTLPAGHRVALRAK